MRKQHPDTIFFSKVARTWVLLFSVPLYIGSTVLWMKEEIKQVLAQEPAPQQFMVSLKKQVKKTAQPENMHQPFILP
ncbi:hypothetical protein TH61_09270 [Rufibacter sp. DG15C]|uniref:hypothetical protein n=1 Tax=Rufibacter sp. DG15C TaxID=1379909 RepID=UPI00078D58CD|nr:hypothetical protein [Rufibacter sp. DG15C]AMM51324.1 hypothetical protein TH61_09270 [Rufibacter sp. DG15C]